MVGQLGCRVFVSGHGEYASRLAGNLSKSRQFTAVREEFPGESANSTAPNITHVFCICGDHLREVLSPLCAYFEKNTKAPVVVCCPESTPAAVRAAVAAGAQVWLTELSTPLAAATAVIYQGVLLSADQQLAGIPDFILQAEDGYTIREVKLALGLENHPEIQAQLGLYAQLLAETTGAPVKGTEVLFGNGQLAPVAASEITRLVERLRSIRSLPKAPDEAVGWSKCNPCGLFDHCWRNAIAAHDPGVVPGIEQGLRNALLAESISRYDDLLSWGEAQLAQFRFQQKTRERRVGAATAQKILRQVQVLANGKLEMLAKPQLPGSGPYVFFDIEANPFEADLEPMVYLWGVLFDPANGAPPRYWGSIAAAGPEGDARAWQDFLGHAAAIIEQYGKIPFIHYTNYERTWVKNYIGPCLRFLVLPEEISPSRSFNKP